MSYLSSKLLLDCGKRSGIKVSSFQLATKKIRVWRAGDFMSQFKKGRVRKSTPEGWGILCRVHVRLSPVWLCVLVQLLTATAPAAMAVTIAAADAALHARPTSSTR
jgi:hypothetical protein